MRDTRPRGNHTQPSSRTRFFRAPAALAALLLATVTGLGAGSWDNFVVVGDAFRTGVGANDTAHNFAPAQTVAAGSLLISEYRLSGPNGVNDEFIEIYNNSDSPHVVTPPDGSTAYTVVSASNLALNDNTPTPRCSLTAGQSIPPRGHFLCTNAVGYSQEAYPGGPGLVTPDAVYATDIPLNDGIALFSTNNPANFNGTYLLDAVGSKLVNNTLYREGVGHSQMPNTIQSTVEHSFVRRLPGGCTGFFNDVTWALNARTCASGVDVTATPGPHSTKPQDTGDNLSDFLYVGINVVGPGTAADNNIQIRLGAPGPENRLSPVTNDARAIAVPNPDQSVGAAAGPNRVRDQSCALTAGVCLPNANLGYLDIRKRVFNHTGSPITRLRFRIVDMSTFPTCGGLFAPCTDGAVVADLRGLTSADFTITVNDPTTGRESSLTVRPELC